MRHVFLSVFAIALAGVAAVAATTAMLNAPVRTSTVAAIPVNGPAPANPPATGAPPASTPDTPADAPKPATSTEGAKPAGGAAAPGNAPAGKDTKEDEADEDPYAGIAPEELPPDLQYSADSSVSFPTNI